MPATLIPIQMTSFNTPVPFVVSSGTLWTPSNPPYDPWHSFNSDALHYIAKNPKTLGSEWIQIDLGVPHNLSEYDFANKGISDGSFVSEWRLSGSNTGLFSGEQTDLDYHVGVTANDTPVRYVLASPGFFRYFRWTLIQGNTYFGIGEIRLYETPPLKHLYQDGTAIKTLIPPNNTTKFMNLNGASSFGSFTSRNLTGNLTLEAWIKTTDPRNTRGYRYDASNTLLGSSLATAWGGFGVTDGKLEYSNGGADDTGHYITSPTKINDDFWHHVAITHNSSSGAAKLYVDGLQVATATLVFHAIPFDRLGRGNVGGFFNGSCRDIRIWTTERSAAQILDNKDLVLIGNEAGLVNYWKTTEGTGTTTADATTSANTISLTSVTWSSGFGNSTWSNVGVAPVSEAMFTASGMSNLSGVSESYLNLLTSVQPILLSYNPGYVAGNPPLTLKMTGDKYLSYRHKVVMTSPTITVQDWTAPLYDNSTNSVTISHTLVDTINPYTVTVTVEQENGTLFTKTVTITLIDTQPTLIATMTGMRLNIDLGDPESDTVQFKIVLNGAQFYPASGFTALEPSPVSYIRPFKSNEILIGQINTLTVTAKDQFGKTSTVTITFVGEYVGLMFSDEAGVLYTTDLGVLLQYLNLGTITAGNTSAVFPVRVNNRNDYSVQNILVQQFATSLPANVILQISKINAPFTPEASLLYPETVAYNGYITFYVRVITTIAAFGSGEFELATRADPL